MVTLTNETTHALLVLLEKVARYDISHPELANEAKRVYTYIQIDASHVTTTEES